MTVSNPLLLAALQRKRRLRPDDMAEVADAQTADNADVLDRVGSISVPEFAPKPPPERVPFSADMQPETSDAPPPSGPGMLSREAPPAQDFTAYAPREPIAPTKTEWGNETPPMLAAEAPKAPDFLGDVASYVPPESTNVAESPPTRREQLAQMLSKRMGGPQVAKTAAPSSAPLTDEQQLASADDSDRRNALIRGIELAGKQFNAGVSRTPVAAMTEAMPSQRAALMQALQAKRQGEQARLAQANVDADNVRADRALAAAEEERKRRAAREGEKDAADRDYRERNLKRGAAHDAATEMLARASLGLKEKGEERAAEKEARGQTLPASTVTELAGLPAAERQVDELVSEFKRLGMGGTAGRAGATVTDALKLQSTDAAEYQAAARRAMQAAGTILEGGKLAAGDEVKYQRMLPQAGDSPEVVAQKADGMKRFLRELASGRIESLKKAGYNAPADLVTPAVKPTRYIMKGGKLVPADG